MKIEPDKCLIFDRWKRESDILLTRLKGWIFAIQRELPNDFSLRELGGFHQDDIERIRSTDIWLRRFLEQQDLDPDSSLNMLWETCKWRKEFGANGNKIPWFPVIGHNFKSFSKFTTDLSEDNLNMEYMHEGLLFPRNRDIDGKVVLVLKSRLHKRGLRDTKQLLRNFIYWIERLNRYD